MCKPREMLRRQGPILGATFSQNLAILFLPNPADISIHTDEGDPTEEGAVVGGQDGGAEGQEGDHDAVQHHPRQQEPWRKKGLHFQGRLSFKNRANRKSQAWQCRGFCTAYFWSSLAYESDEQKTRILPNLRLPISSAQGSRRS